MTAIALLLDLTIVAALLLLAGQALFHPSLFADVVFFIAFSLLLGLAWARLRAPDVALAETAIGAGLTGALLLASVRRIVSAESPASQEQTPHDVP